ncbi:hypothetical protein Cus16_1112 [Curtobacterium sp. ER1/6]|nr:hypothetical protein Cus16_1112 [Curtobacterium sp. ER1/6]
MAVAAVVGVADHRVGPRGADRRADVVDDLAEVGRGERVDRRVGGGRGTPVRPPLHAGVGVPPLGQVGGARSPAAEPQVRRTPEGGQRGGDLGLAVRGHSGTVAEERREGCGEHLPAFTPGRGQDRDLGTELQQGGDGPAGRQGLVVGVGVHEQDALGTRCGSLGHRVPGYFATGA